MGATSSFVLWSEGAELDIFDIIQGGAIKTCGPSRFTFRIAFGTSGQNRPQRHTPATKHCADALDDFVREDWENTGKLRKHLKVFSKNDRVLRAITNAAEHCGVSTVEHQVNGVSAILVVAPTTCGELYEIVAEGSGGDYVM